MAVTKRTKKTYPKRKRLNQEKKINERLRQVDQIKNQFLANTSHELRTPLIGIVGVADSLIEGIGGDIPRNAQSNLKLISDSGRRLSYLVDDILDFSKIRNKELKLKISDVDLRGKVDLVSRLLIGILKGKGLEFENKIAQDLPLVHADENRLQQILLNLIGNAIKFTEQGKITLDAKIRSTEIWVSVTDTGIGIDPSMFERIFQSFEQIDGSNTRQYGGTGLGLAITKQLIELQEGKIWVDSEPGKGSTFTFSLPIGENAPGKSAQIKLTPQFKDQVNSPQNIITIDRKLLFPDVKILIVDDEPVNLQVLYNYLTVAGYHVEHANTGLKALKMVEDTGPFDLIILDVMMPRISGLEVCEKLREKYLPSELPIIMLTAKSQIADIIDGFDAGANDYLRKPFTKEELLSRIKVHLRLHQIHKATGRFVPYEFLHSIGRDEITEVVLGDHAHYQNISVLFVDIREYTSLSESMTPEENFLFVNAFVGRIGPVIEKHNGFVGQYLGDAILAIFSKRADDGLNAAVEMQLIIREYNQQRETEDRRKIDIGIGIHTGHLIMGVIGYYKRTDPAIVADTVNIASRMEGLTKHYGVKILISDRTYHLLENPERFSFRYLGQVKVKGKDQVLGIYECLDGENSKLKNLKVHHNEQFQQGIDQFKRGEFLYSSSTFAAILKENPNDITAKMLLLRSNHYIESGSPKDWDGVEAIQTK